MTTAHDAFPQPKHSPIPELTIFYDGSCPLCVHEMRKLYRLNQSDKLAFVDIQSPGMAEQYPELDVQAARDMLHGQRPDGTWLYGLDVTHAAWSAVGRGWLTAPLRWPGIRRVADRFYLWFAPRRYTLSRLLTGSSRCRDCELK